VRAKMTSFTVNRTLYYLVRLLQGVNTCFQEVHLLREEKLGESIIHENPTAAMLLNDCM